MNFNLGFSAPGIDIHADLFLGLSLYDLTVLFVAVMAFIIIWKWLWMKGQRRETVTLP